MFKKLRQKLAKAIWVDDEPKKVVSIRTPRSRGFIDYKTGRRVDIIPGTDIEVFVG